MHISNLTFPDNVERPSRQELAVFTEELWRNQEICNNCFSQIRTIGPTAEKQLEQSGSHQLRHGDPLTVEITAWHDRVDDKASQEHTPWDEQRGTVGNRRFGTCFCLECGSGDGREDQTVSLDDLVEQSKRIVRYLKTQTRYSVDGGTFGQTLSRLKRERDNQGYSTEILAVATATALESTTPNIDQYTQAPAD
jgi:hypothetical protein